MISQNIHSNATGSFNSSIQICPSCEAPIDITGREPLEVIGCPRCDQRFAISGQIGNYQIMEVAGHGGMGVVYKAYDPSLDRYVALKLLKKSKSHDAQLIQLLGTEASITASVTHPNVVRVFGTGSERGRFFIVMELVEHGSLDDLTRLPEPVPEVQVLEIAVQIASGLRAALQRGLIHRDIKPGNILFSDGRTAKIVDFGLAIFMAQEESARGEIWGTPYYVAPEKLEQEPEDFRSDMYSLGGTLYHALAGRPPFEAENASLVALKHVKSQAVRIQAFAPWVSNTTAHIIDRCLSKNPANRYQSYDALIESLEYALAELHKNGDSPKPRTRHVDAAEEYQKVWTWLFGAMALIVVILVATFFGMRPKQARSMAKNGARPIKTVSEDTKVNRVDDANEASSDTQERRVAENVSPQSARGLDTNIPPYTGRSEEPVRSPAQEISRSRIESTSSEVAPRPRTEEPAKSRPEQPPKPAGPQRVYTTALASGSMQPGLYRLINKQTGKDVDSIKSETDKTAPLSNADYNGQATQLWEVSDFPLGDFRLRSFHSQSSMDLYQQSKNDGAPIDVWKSHKGISQQWKIEPQAPGIYKIRSACSNKVLCVSDSKLVQRGEDSSPDQLWQLQRIGSRLNDDWFMATIGERNPADSVELAGDQFVVSDQESAVRTSKDKGTFVTRYAQGDFDLVVHVASAAESSNSGLMIRANMTADAPCVGVLINKQIITLRRGKQDDQIAVTSGPVAMSSCWLKLERRGASITTSYSADGNTWSQLATDRVEMNPHAFAGIVLAGHTPNKKAISRFDKLTYTKR